MFCCLDIPFHNNTQDGNIKVQILASGFG